MLPQLQCGPRRGRMSGHMEVQDATSVMGQPQKQVEYLEADRRHREEVDRNQLLCVILQECAPGLRWGFARGQHIVADSALSDVDAEFEKFAVDAGCTASGVLPAHLRSEERRVGKECRSRGSP